MDTIDAAEIDGLLSEYNENGFLRIELPPAQIELLHNFLRECSIWLEHFAGVNTGADSLAAVLPLVAQDDRDIVSKLYKVSRRFPSVKRLASDPWLGAVAAKFMGTPFAASCHFVNVRIDLPEEEKYLLPPHQDFPYIQDSINSITWWIPFFDTPVITGPPVFIPGSHKLGVLKVREFDFESIGLSGGKSFSIADVSLIAGMSYEPNSLVKRGEAIIFNALTVHRSEPNNSSIARLSVQLRFSDPLSRDSFDRNYPEGLYLGDNFSKSYPEHVVRSDL